MTMISKRRKGEYANLAFSILQEAGGDMHNVELLAEMKKRLTLTPDELHIYEDGRPRWDVHARFQSTAWAKAGLIRKKSGRWYLTPEGAALIGRPPEDIVDRVAARYQEWRRNRPDTAANPAVETDDHELDEQMAVILETAENRAREEIREFIQSMGPYDFQDLVAALLRGMGYVTPFVAPKGPDGGTDVLAYLDPLGAKTPHMRVQVKHRQDKASNAEVASLQGNLRADREIGLFVSSGGFTKEAERQMQRGQAHMELIDLDRFIDLWTEYYQKLNDEDRARLPLRAVFFLAPRD